MRNTVVVFLFILSITVSCQDDKRIYINVSENLMTVDNIVIDLDRSVTDAINLLNVEFQVESIPGSDAYYSEKSRFEFFSDTETGLILGIIYKFYKTNKFDNVQFTIDDTTLNSAVSFNDMVLLLKNKGFDLEIRDSSLSKIIKIKKHRIIAIKYLKKDLAKAYSVEFE